jgi:hypothetical protein
MKPMEKFFLKDLLSLQRIRNSKTLSLPIQDNSLRYFPRRTLKTFVLCDKNLPFRGFPFLFFAMQNNSMIPEVCVVLHRLLPVDTKQALCFGLIAPPYSPIPFPLLFATSCYIVM